MKNRVILEQTQLMNLVRDIENCGGAKELALLLDHTLLEAIGAYSWLFLAYSRDNASESDPWHNYVIGRNPEWSSMYEGQKLHRVDPSFQYAQHNSAPAQLSTLPAPQAAAREQLLQAREHFNFPDGFGYVFPAHCAITGRVGALEIFWKKRNDSNLARIEALLPALRMVSIVTLDIVLKWAKADLIEKSGLNEAEISLLRYSAQGYRSKEIARFNDTSRRAVDEGFARITRKLGVKRRTQAINKAQSFGVVR